MLHVKLQVSPGLGMPFSPNEQLYAPLLGLVGNGQVTSKKTLHLLVIVNGAVSCNIMYRCTVICTSKQAKVCQY